MATTGKKVAVALAIVLALGSFGSLKGAFFARHFVTSQLVEQKLRFSPYEADKEVYDSTPSLKKYAGKPIVNGWQARQYANVIDHHVKKTTGGKSYSEMSSLARTNPQDQKLQDARRTALDGQLLRGTLLNVYGWWWIGTIALWAGWIMLMLAVVSIAVGFVPKRRAATPSVPD